MTKQRHTQRSKASTSGGKPKWDSVGAERGGGLQEEGMQTGIKVSAG